VQKSADGIIVSGEDFHCSVIDWKEGQDTGWMPLSQLGAACRTKDTDRDGDLNLDSPDDS
jgi:hypothetical protein